MNADINTRSFDELVAATRSEIERRYPNAADELDGLARLTAECAVVCGATKDPLRRLGGIDLPDIFDATIGTHNVHRKNVAPFLARVAGYITQMSIAHDVLDSLPVSLGLVSEFWHDRDGWSSRDFGIDPEVLLRNGGLGMGEYELIAFGDEGSCGSGAVALALEGDAPRPKMVLVPTPSGTQTQWRG